jgi:hypothetical protein
VGKVLLQTQKWRKIVTPIITQYAPKDSTNKDETAEFYNAQLKRALALNQEKYQGGERE